MHWRMDHAQVLRLTSRDTMPNRLHLQSSVAWMRHRSVPYQGTKACIPLCSQGAQYDVQLNNLCTWCRSTCGYHKPYTCADACRQLNVGQQEALQLPAPLNCAHQGLALHIESSQL